MERVFHVDFESEPKEVGTTVVRQSKSKRRVEEFSIMSLSWITNCIVAFCASSKHPF